MPQNPIRRILDQARRETVNQTIGRELSLKGPRSEGDSGLAGAVEEDGTIVNVAIFGVSYFGEDVFG